MTRRTARAVIDEGVFMTLATADADGVPWASPVWFAPNGYSELLWVSDPNARHSRNIAARPEIAIVIFDSRQTPGDGLAVYMEARAEQAGADGLEVFNARERRAGPAGVGPGAGDRAGAAPPLPRRRLAALGAPRRHRRARAGQSVGLRGR